MADKWKFLLEVCIEYKAEQECCGIDWELIRNKYEQTQEKLIQQYRKNSTDGFDFDSKTYWWKT